MWVCVFRSFVIFRYVRVCIWGFVEVKIKCSLVHLWHFTEWVSTHTHFRLSVSVFSETLVEWEVWRVVTSPGSCGPSFLTPPKFFLHPWKNVLNPESIRRPLERVLPQLRSTHSLYCELLAGRGYAATLLAGGNQASLLWANQQPERQSHLLRSRQHTQETLLIWAQKMQNINNNDWAPQRGTSTSCVVAHCGLMSWRFVFPTVVSSHWEIYET